jgi:hypothetical protein
MKMKTSELTGAALDWAVAKCEGLPVTEKHYDLRFIDEYPFSTDWAQGGPIIERKGIRIVKVAPTVWGAVYSSGDVGREHFATTPLIAAMRCYVTNELGDEVDVPNEIF